MTSNALRSRFDGTAARLRTAVDGVARTTLDQLFSEENLGRYGFLFATPAEILVKEEQVQLEGLLRESVDKRASLRSHTFMIMKATRLCNLRCTYCHSWREGPGQIMPFDSLARATRDVLCATGVNVIDFIWHGGETTLLPIAFFEKALWLQNFFRRPGQLIRNSIQTNGTKLDDAWVEFFGTHDISVGVSVDGPEHIHDSRRVSAGGQRTFYLVKEGLTRLRNANVPFGVLAVIDSCVVRYGASEFLRFLVDSGIRSVALLNVIPDNLSTNAALAPRSDYLSWDAYVSFLRELFALWWRDYREDLTIRELQSLADRARGGLPSVCEFAGNCMGQFLTIEPNGEVSACDKYIGDTDYVFGNLRTAQLPTILHQSQTLLRARNDVNERKTRMRDCLHYDVCFGGCPHDARLNQYNTTGWTGQCCGLSELIEDIKAMA